jgi:hypothetical protein
MWTENFPEAVDGSADGWIDDTLAFVPPWGFSLSDIKVPVLLWHSEKTCSPRWRTPAGWPARSEARSFPSNRAPCTSVHPKESPTFFPG